MICRGEGRCSKWRLPPCRPGPGPALACLGRELDPRDDRHQPADPGLLPVTNLREPHLVEPGQHMPGVGPADLSALGDRAA
jgi:hypothetical protein